MSLMPFRNVLPGTKMAYDVSGNIDRVGVRNIARTDCLALLRDFVLCRFEWIRKDLSSAQGSHLYRFRDASCSARPTAASSRPLRCMRKPILVCLRAARPISVPSRPLRCSCAAPIVSASVRFCPSLFREAHSRPLPSASLHQSVRFYMFPYREAHHSQPSSASLHPYVRFSLFPSSEAYPSVFLSASQAPGISCPGFVHPSQHVLVLRSPQRSFPVRFAASAGPFQPVSEQRRPS